jgi:hypothetical protein
MFTIRGYRLVGNGIINEVLTTCKTEEEAKEEVKKYSNSDIYYNVHYY